MSENRQAADSARDTERDLPLLFAMSLMAVLNIGMGFGLAIGNDVSPLCAWVWGVAGGAFTWAALVERGRQYGR